jgi:hypothetical protein
MKPAHCSILQFTVILSFVYCNLVAEETSSATNIHTLTWIEVKNENGLHEIFSLDGKELGDIDKVTDAFREKPLQKGDVLNIRYPDSVNLDGIKYKVPEPGPNGEDKWMPIRYMPPFTEIGLADLFLKGVKLQFFYKRKQRDVRFFWWNRHPSDPNNLNITEFYLDGAYLGDGDTGLKKLADVKWGDYPAVFIVQWYGDETPYRSVSSLGGPFGSFTDFLFLNQDVRESFSKQKVHASDWFFGNAIPILHPNAGPNKSEVQKLKSKVNNK